MSPTQKTLIAVKNYSMKTNHKREVLSKLVNDKDFRKVDGQAALDMSKTGFANAMLNEAIEVLRDKKWKV